MNILQVNTKDNTDVNKFINLPFNLYRNNPYWVPPLVGDMRFLLNRTKHPFYSHSEADFFIAEEKGEVLGRIAVLNHRPYNSYHNSKKAFFYFFDSINDTNVSQKLFAHAAEWAKVRNLEYLVGPKGFLRSSGAGLLTEGFELLPAMGIPYNYPYYSYLLDDFGFEKETDFLSGFLTPEITLPPELYQIAAKVIERGTYWVKSFHNRAEMRKWINTIDQVHTESFSTNPNYIPSTPEEFYLIANTIIQIAIPSMIKFIMKGDAVVGFILTYPNIGVALQKIRGRLFPFGWVLLILQKHISRRVDMNGIGLLPTAQGMGANALLYFELEKTLRSRRADIGELVQIDERNFLSKSDMEKLGVTWYKKHRVYSYKII